MNRSFDWFIFRFLFSFFLKIDVLDCVRAALVSASRRPQRSAYYQQETTTTNWGVKVNAEKDESLGALVIYNLKDEDVRFDTDLQKFLGVEQTPAVSLKLGTRTNIIRLNSPSSYFIHCDAM